ncbi:MAG: Fic family protein, partial [Actinobacteria bacterium]|nr:Fic family protein [Actinomycetota bacterium]
HEKDDLEGWLRFFLEGVSTTAEKAARTVGKVLSLRERDMQAAAGLGAVGENAVKVLNHLYGSPYVRIKDVETITGLSNPNAIALIGKMTRLEILSEITGRKRNKVFAYLQYIGAFSN